MTINTPASFMIFSRTDLLASFSAEKIHSAESEVELATTPNIQREGEIISATVRAGGEGARPYRVYIRVIKNSAGKADFRGECSCPLRKNCKHVLIVLLAALGNNSNEIPTKSVQPNSAVHRRSRTASNIRLLYVLEAQRSVLSFRLYTARIVSSGGYGQFSEFRVTDALLRRPPGFLDESDRAILSALKLDAGGCFFLPDDLLAEEVEQLIQQLLNSERCFGWMNSPETIKLATPLPAKASWRLAKNGDQEFFLRTQQENVQTGILPIPWYLDVKHQQLGLLQLAIPSRVLHRLEQISPVAPENIVQVQRDLSQTFSAFPIPELRPLTLELLDDTAPVPHLLLSRNESGEALLAKLSFDYGGYCIDQDSGNRIHHNLRIIEVIRDKTAERQYINVLEHAGLKADFNNPEWAFSAPAEKNLQQHFLLLELPKLFDQGWKIRTAENLQLQIAEADEWYGDLIAENDGDWFSLDLGVIINGERLPLLPALSELISIMPNVLSRQGLAQLSDNSRIHAPLQNGCLIPVPVRKLRRILETLVEIFEPGLLGSSGAIKMSRWQVASLAEFDVEAADGSEWSWNGDAALRELAGRLREIDEVPTVKPPVGLRASLRPYQQRGLDWLQFLREFGLAGVLADDMGLGKTLQTLAHILLEKEQGRLNTAGLIIAPTSLLSNWRNEAERFTPDLRVLLLHGPKRRELFAKIGAQDLIITSYGLALRDAEIHRQQDYHLLVLDEAQVIKNSDAKISQASRRIPATHKLCLSGTPMENHLGELWSLFDFLMPGFLGSTNQFQQLFRTPIEKEADQYRGEVLARRLRPYLLRRTKSLVAKELPARSNIVSTVTLAGEQRELYESVRLAMQRRVREAVEENGLTRSSITILDALLKLRQTCCDPRLVKLKAAAGVTESAKLTRLMDMLPEMVEEGRRILLFSQFTAMLALIEKELGRCEIPYVSLTGQTRDRARVIDRFQQGEVPVFLISLKAGGTGLNLTAADTVIHYDPWWNPAVEEQATARAHRIGQKNPVFVYKLISEGTVEEKIQQMQRHKKHLADALYEGKGNVAPQWSAEDLENLFQPI